jgi:2-hydroxychromene-2-carboxylate isomerase
LAQSVPDLLPKDALKTATREAVDRGVFGAPTFFVGDQMFWGRTGWIS